MHYIFCTVVWMMYSHCVIASICLSLNDRDLPCLVDLRTVVGFVCVGFVSLAIVCSCFLFWHLLLCFVAFSCCFVLLLCFVALFCCFVLLLAFVYFVFWFAAVSCSLQLYR
eukprot:GHVS01094003.1.p1 GENE.GHVS01094003.1~~GHVS01094003.1.p1  ORF type:complete len:111 (+),score=16.19 GHVS01094003.1:180-512(+)